MNPFAFAALVLITSLHAALAPAATPGANSVHEPVKDQAPVRIEANTQVVVSGLSLVPFNIREEAYKAGGVETRGMTVALTLVSENGKHQVRVHAGEKVEFEGRKFMIDRVGSTFIVLSVL